MVKAWIIGMMCFMPALLLADNDSIPRKRSFLRKTWDGAKSIIKEFNNVDTAYIEPQHYKFTTTLMSTYSFEKYRITSKTGQTIEFSPEARVKIGPYFGWSLLFWGYTFELAYISSKKKKEFDLSIYTSMFGVDFFLRNTGRDYRIRSLDLNDKAVEDSVSGIPFDGLNVSITGLNAYYIPNHRKFSYPAAFSQSTCQRKSAGSFMFGGGYTRHALKLDFDKLKSAVGRVSPQSVERLDSGLMFKDIKYTDISLSAGYGYNWVFSTNWLLSVSLSAALGYKHTTGDRWVDLALLRDFSFTNFNIDGVGRLGVIWNNSKWYFGAYGIIHSYNYRKSQFQTNNYFGNVKVYIGINFGRKKSHRIK